MSFVRVPRRSQSLSGRNKKTKKKKPTWDSTTSDLTVHKLSKDELDRRHAVHQSTNLDVIKEEKRRRTLLKANKERSLSEGNQAGLLREILYDEKQLNDALAHSDRVMSVVKDLFYDDPKRLKAIPHITRAPGGDADRRRAGPISEKVPHTSYLDVLSESVMDPSALNEYQEEDSEEEETGDEDDDEEEETPVFDSKLDVDRFQSYIQRAAAEKPLEREERRQHKRHSNKENMDPAGTPDRPPLTASQQRAINDTAKAKKKRRSRSKAKGQSSVLDVTQKTKPEDLRMYLNELMSACSAFDRTRGEEEAEDVSHSFSSGFPQLSGYTAFLVQTLTKILEHLNESETQLAQEREARRRLEQETSQQRKLIDAMTVDMMQSQELNMQIQAEARKQINQMEQRLQIVEHLMVNQDFLDVPPPSGNEKKDTPERIPAVSEAQASKSIPSASSTGTGTTNFRTSSQSKSVQQTVPKSAAGQIPTQTVDSVPAVSTEATLPSTRTGHVTVTGMTGTKPSVSQAQSTAATANSRNVLSATEALSHKVSSSSNPVPQLSQHTMDRLMSSRQVQSSGNMHLTGNLANIQTNVPSGIQSYRSQPAGHAQRPMDGMDSMSGFGMSSNELKGRDPISIGNTATHAIPVASNSSRQQKSDASMSSSAQHLHPIQPAMLLSPPRQKDRRDFIKPPGHQPQSFTAAPYSQTHGGITGMNSYSSAGIRMSTQQPRVVSFGSTPRFPGEWNHPVRRNDLMSGMHSQVRHPPAQPLLNNYTSNLAGQVETAPSITSVDSSSTRYLSLPGDHGGTNVIKNLLHQDTSDNAQQFPPHTHPGRMGPNGQDHHHQTSRSNHPAGMDTVYESSMDGTVEPRGEDTSVDLNEKIASLSRQRVEAQARLEQLKDVYGGEGGIAAPQRPTTSGGEATDHRPLSTKHTGVLIGDSPPVSPIARDPPSQRPIPTGTSHVAPGGRTLHVSMPKLSELEISATSTPASKRTSIGSGGPSPNINQNDWKTPMKDSPGKEQFFALKAHIST